MEHTYMLIEVTKSHTKGTIIEDIHGVSDDVNILKDVAKEEYAYKELKWYYPVCSIVETADITLQRKLQIIQISKFTK